MSRGTSRRPLLALPAGERVLWQGAPAWRAVFLRVFHARALALYFLVLLGIRALLVLDEGGGVSEALQAAALLLPAPLFALAMLALIAWLIERTSHYTITERRLVMQVGVVLDATFNFPFAVVESAGLKTYADGSGDLSLAFLPGNSIGYAHLWPHVRPWRLRKAEPTLRCVADATTVAEILSGALREAVRGAARGAVPTRQSVPALRHVAAG